MPTTLKKLPASIAYPEKISILLISSSPADMPALRGILHHSHWHLAQAGGVREAQQQLNRDAPQVIVCERDLPDGGWKNVLCCANEVAAPPLVLVVSRTADEALWAEVLNLGGYDVLLKPFDRAEVVRIVGMAWRQWWNQASRPGARAIAAAQTA
jgi:DNA-binding response OmpR family regulator